MTDALAICGLTVDFATRAGTVRALDDVSLTVQPGRIVGLVGESGSGKSALAAAVLRLLPANAKIASGEIRIDGTDARMLRDSQMRRLRGRAVGFVPQEPMNALNPTLRVGRQLRDVLCLDPILRHSDLNRRAEALMSDLGVGDPKRVLASYPFELSGGLRQRVLLALAFAHNPRLLIADEPTTALDVTIQAQVLAILRGRCAQGGTAALFITHNMGVVWDLCDEIVVLRRGAVVESGDAKTVLSAPRHPYTRLLLESLPERGEHRRPLAQGLEDASVL